MIKSNYHYINRLGENIEDEKIINGIIFLDTYLGSYKARANFEKILDFRKRAITSSILESECIITQRRETLTLLENMCPEALLKKLEENMIKIEQDSPNIPKEGLYNQLDYFKRNEQTRQQAGERIKTRLANRKCLIRDNMLEKEVKNLLLKEHYIMKEALYYEHEY